MVVQGEWDTDPKTQVQKSQGEPVLPVTSPLLSQPDVRAVYSVELTWRVCQRLMQSFFPNQSI